MNEFYEYPKCKYRAGDGSDYVIVAGKEEEEALGDGFFDTPEEARSALELLVASVAEKPSKAKSE